jgi:hypothetical protein
MRSGRLDLRPLKPKLYALANLETAMVEAERADSLEYTS